jgi:uncharacterized protein YndB with AHSA1/START domain
MAKMINVNRDTVPVGLQELVITRVLDAPREKVWQAWTEPEQLLRWWGPKDVKMVITRMDLHPGGVFLYGLSGPDGKNMWGKFNYKEISAPERLVFINSFSDENGSVTRNPMNPNWPLEVMNIFTLSELAGKTSLILRGSPHSASDVERKTFLENHENIRKGFAGTFEQLESFLADTK